MGETAGVRAVAVGQVRDQRGQVHRELQTGSGEAT